MLGDALFVWQLLGYPRDRISGIPVYVCTDDRSFVPLWFAKVERALGCIEDHDPRRLAGLRRDVGRIIVTANEGNHYVHRWRAIVLKWPIVFHRDAESNALTLVHEATHARIRRRGIAYAQELRYRIEAACVGEEAAFARRLPNGASRVEEIRKVLESPWWSDEQLIERRLQAIRDTGAPSWLVRLIGAVVVRRWGRAAERVLDRTDGR